jgi:hypothetical protein
MLGDIAAPLSENDKKALRTLFQMFWGSSEKEVSREDWEKFNAIRTPSSNQFILKPSFGG